MPGPESLKEIRELYPKVRAAVEQELFSHYHLQPRAEAGRNFENAYLTYLFIRWQTENPEADWPMDFPEDQAKALLGDLGTPVTFELLTWQDFENW